MPEIKPTIIRSKRMSIALQIKPDAQLIVKAPFFTPEWMINQFLKQHEEWIEKNLKKVQARPIAKKRGYKNGETFFYFGKEYTLEIGEYKEIVFANNTLQFPKFLEFRIQKELEAWYIREAKKVITEQLEHYAKEMGLLYNEVRFSDTMSKWGSCTHDNRLQFNWRLIMAPILAINYVVVHELAHTVEKNHSQDFWRVVGKHNPTFRHQRKWLSDHGHLLMN